MAQDLEDVSEFYLTNGELSEYGFSCGYVEVYRQDMSESARYTCNYVELYREGGTYHLKWGQGGEKYSGWENHDTLTEARQAYREIKTIIRRMF